MHTFNVVFLLIAAVLFGVDAWLSKSLLAAGLLAWVLAFLVPLLVG